MSNAELILCAKDAMLKAYAPYSRFYVGAALLCSDGRVYQGCNIENASYSATVCAERNAIFQAVKDGVRDFVAIAVVGGGEGKITGYVPPCGICRQVLREFCRDDFQVIFGGKDETYTVKTLAELLPCDFSAAELER